MKYNCPNCNQAYEIEAEHNGMHFQCEKCEKYFKVEIETQKADCKIIEQQKQNSNSKTLFSKQTAKKTAEPTQKILENSKTLCPMCFSEINPEAFKCSCCGEILRTKSGKPPVDRVGYIIVGALLGWFGFHYLYAKQVVDFFMHIGIAIIVPAAAAAIAVLIGFKELYVFFLTLFSMVFIVYTIFTVARDPNR